VNDDNDDVCSCRRVHWLLWFFCCWLFSLHSVHCCRCWQRPRRHQVPNIGSLVSSPTQDAAFPLVYKTCKFFNGPADWLQPFDVRVILYWCCLYWGNTSLVVFDTVHWAGYSAVQIFKISVRIKYLVTISFDLKAIQLFKILNIKGWTVSQQENVAVCSAVVNNGLDSFWSLYVGPVLPTNYWKIITACLQHKLQTGYHKTV